MRRVHSCVCGIIFNVLALSDAQFVMISFNILSYKLGWSSLRISKNRFAVFSSVNCHALFNFYSGFKCIVPHVEVICVLRKRKEVLNKIAHLINLKFLDKTPWKRIVANRFCNILIFFFNFLNNCYTNIYVEY